MADFNAIYSEISGILQAGRAKEIVGQVQKALDAGATASDILNKALIAGMDIIGEKYQREEIFVPEVLLAARAMNKASAVLKPYLVGEGIKPLGQAIICTVKGDCHDIGKNLVKMMMEGKGIEMIDLGCDCPPSKIVEAVKNSNARVVCLSTLLTTTMENQKNTIDALKAAGLRDRVKVMIGGAPVTQEFADEIGAYAYTADAAAAAEVCKSFF
jgi:5-methyltetrahydrofolate--homocysteine methyltransferase